MVCCSSYSLIILSLNHGYPDSLAIIKEIVENTNNDYVGLGAPTNRSPPPPPRVAAPSASDAHGMAHAVIGPVPAVTPSSVSAGAPEMNGLATPGTSKPSNNIAASEDHADKQPDEAPLGAASTEPTTQTSVPSRPGRSGAKSRSIPTSAGASVPARTTRSTANADANASGNLSMGPRRSMRQEESGTGGSRSKRAHL